MSEEKSFELAPYLRDPWTLRYFKHEGTRIEEILLFSKGAIRSLLGEVFLEEERSLSAVYEGIIRALSIGKWRFKEVSDLLHSRGLIPRADPSLIRPYFNNMEEMDLVTKIPLYKTKNYKYIVKSPIMETGFLLDEKLNLFEEDIPEKRIKESIDKKIASHMEIFCGQIFAELYDGRFEYFYSKDFDIDFLPVQDQLYHGTQFALLHMFPKTRSLNGDMLHLLIRRICINSNIKNCKQSLYDIMNELYPNQTIKSNPTYKNKENNGLKEVK